jgi:hypothetical protein
VVDMIVAACLRSQTPAYRQGTLLQALLPRVPLQTRRIYLRLVAIQLQDFF